MLLEDYNYLDITDLPLLIGLELMLFRNYPSSNYDDKEKRIHLVVDIIKSFFVLNQVQFGDYKKSIEKLNKYKGIRKLVA